MSAAKSKIMYANRFKEYHEFLKTKNVKEFNSSVVRICTVLGCNTTSFYRKLKNPYNLSQAEKIAIAAVYCLPPHFIFPELEKTAA